MAAKKKHAGSARPIAKAATGIDGLDEITGGGLPRGRPTLLVGGPGCGKTMLAAEFIIQGARRFDEPGVFMMFEENAEELADNVRSLGFDLDTLCRQKKVAVDFVRIERSEIEETGEYDLEGLFIRLGHAIDSVGAKRVVLDTIEALFSGLSDHAVLRAELRRLFRWLMDRGMTAVITGERGASTLTRYGLEEYVADCVIVLDHRINDNISTRRLRVLKYRGSAHGTNEYPFLIGDQGILVLPVTAIRVDRPASNERVSTGIAELDAMLGGRGVFRDSSILVSGAPGTGKSSVGASIADAACARGERVLMFVYEESAAHVVRNMRSIGLDLARWVKKGRLRIQASRPALLGLEQHLVEIHAAVREFAPSVVVVDPISNLSLEREDAALRPTLTRLVDSLKEGGMTAVYTLLVDDSVGARAESQVAVSSTMDVWLLLTNAEWNGERTRALQVVKSRGTPHSNQVREFLITDRGIALVDVYADGGRVLTGRSRAAAQGVDAPAPAERAGAARRSRA